MHDFSALGVSFWSADLNDIHGWPGWRSYPVEHHWSRLATTCHQVATTEAKFCSTVVSADARASDSFLSREIMKGVSAQVTKQEMETKKKRRKKRRIHLNTSVLDQEARNEHAVVGRVSLKGHRI